MAVAAVEGLISGKHNVMVGVQHNKIVYNGIEVIQKRVHEIDEEALRIAKILSI